MTLYYKQTIKLKYIMLPFECTFYLKGIGQTQLFEPSFALEIPCMANTTFSREHEDLRSSNQESSRRGKTVGYRSWRYRR